MIRIAWIGQIDVPTAVVITEHDLTVPPRQQRFLAHAIPGAVAFPVPSDHRAVADSPELFLPEPPPLLDLLLEFELRLEPPLELLRDDEPPD